jgi:hypothetical protein
MNRQKSLSIAALVVALFALVASLGGGSFAAGVLTGKDIKNNSITGKDVKNKSLKGKDVKDKSLTGADVKDGSLGAADLAAGTLTSTAKSVRVTATSGATSDAARTAAPETVLFSKGPFTVYAKCFTDASGPNTNAYVYIRTSSNGALLDSDDSDYDGGSVATDFLNTDTAEVDRSLQSTSSGTNGSDYYKNNFGAHAADGTGLTGLMTVGAKNGTLGAAGDGAFGPGDACVFESNITSN